MDLSLSGRRALVTGAGMGIGRAVAEALAAEGVHVAALDIDEKALAELVRRRRLDHRYRRGPVHGPGVRRRRRQRPSRRSAGSTSSSTTSGPVPYEPSTSSPTPTGSAPST